MPVLFPSRSRVLKLLDVLFRPHDEQKVRRLATRHRGFRFVSVPEGLDAVIPIFGQLKGVGARSVGESEFSHFLPIFKGPYDHRAGHGPGVGFGPG